jgi:hypothetical protein
VEDVVRRRRGPTVQVLEETGAEAEVVLEDAGVEAAVVLLHEIAHDVRRRAGGRGLPFRDRTGDRGETFPSLQRNLGRCSNGCATWKQVLNTLVE